MNNTRRKVLKEFLGQIETFKADLESIVEEEQEYFDSIPENLQSSERYEKAEECVNNLDSAVSSLDECIEYINAAIE